jgi:hypothetical protein
MEKTIKKLIVSVALCAVASNSYGMLQHEFQPQNKPSTSLIPAVFCFWYGFKNLNS